METVSVNDRATKTAGASSNSPCESPIPEKNDGGWDSYWESLSDCCQLFHEQAKVYVNRLELALPVDSKARVLDFGCGFGFVAAILASHVGEIFLWDASTNMRQRARANVSGHSNVRFIDLAERGAIASELRFDLILVNSVVQYMSHDEFHVWFQIWRDMLVPGGRIVVSDLISPAYPCSLDVVDVLRFSARTGVLVRALWQLVGEFWRYWRVRRACSLTRIEPKDLIRLGQTGGFTVSFLPTNLTHFTNRSTAVFTRVT
jgi:SAM-dependent methyltransferase